MKLVKISNEYYLLDGEINDGDKILHEGDILTVNKNKGAYLSTYQFPHIDIKADVCDKIIGSSNSFFGTEIPFLDRNKIEKLLNSVDVEKIAEQMIESHPDFKSEGFSDYQNGRFNGIIDGYNKALSDNSDKKFTLDDMRKCFEASRETIKHPDWDNIYDNFEHYMKSKSEEKKEWSVEIEMDVVPDFESRSRYNDGQIYNGLKKLVPLLNNGYITITKIKQ
jgi:hypothetical protein